MKITIYTIKDCAFSKQEREYLNTNKLVFEEKDLETNKDFLTEMLAISNNFAGTPVTRVEKDDGSIAVLKGFTKEEFDTTFGFAVAPTDSTVSTDSTIPPQVNDTPIPPVTEVPPTPPVETVSPAPVSTPPVEAPINPTPTDSTVSTDSTVTPDPLKSVMDDLQAKAESVTAAPPVVETPPAVEQPTVVPPADAPTIPDFPAK